MPGVCARCFPEGQVGRGRLNVLIMSSAFFLLLMAFAVVQNLATTVNAEAGFYSLLTFYVSAGVSCLVSPLVFVRLSPKVALFVGALAMVLFCGATIYVLLPTLIVAAVLAGFGYGLAWAAEGAVMVGNSDDASIGLHTGIFFAFVYASQIAANFGVGLLLHNGVEYMYLFIGCTVLGLLGSLIVLLLRPPARVTAIVNHKPVMDTASEYADIERAGVAMSELRRRREVAAGPSNVHIGESLEDDDEDGGDTTSEYNDDSVSAASGVSLSAAAARAAAASNSGSSSAAASAAEQDEADGDASGHSGLLSGARVDQKGAGGKAARGGAAPQRAAVASSSIAREAAAARRAECKSAMVSVFRVLRDRRMLLLLMLSIVSGVADEYFYGSMPYEIGKVSAEQIGFVLAAFGVACVVASVVSAKIANMRRSLKLAFVMCSLHTGGAVLCVVSQQMDILYTYYGAAVAFGVAESLNSNVLYGVAGYFFQKYPAASFAVVRGVMSLGSAAAFLYGEQLPFIAVSGCLAGCSVLAVVLFGILFRKEHLSAVREDATASAVVDVAAVDAASANIELREVSVPVPIEAPAQSDAAAAAVVVPAAAGAAASRSTELEGRANDDADSVSARISDVTALQLTEDGTSANNTWASGAPAAESGRPSLRDMFAYSDGGAAAAPRRF